MARRLSVSITTTNGTASTSQLEALCGLRAFRIYSVQCFLTTAVASTFGIGITPLAGKGVTPTTPLAFVGNDQYVDTNAPSVAVAWGTPPSTPTIFARRVSTPATVGFSWEWKWEQGYTVPFSRSLSIHNTLAGACALMQVNIEAEE